MDIMLRTIDLARRGEHEAAVSIVRTNVGKTVMDRARRLIGEMREREDARLEERTDRMRRNFDRATRIEAAAGLGLIVLGLVLFMIHRDLARREALEKALRDEATFQQRFMGILGHDLRNPLGAITMAASHLERASMSVSDLEAARDTASDMAKRIGSSATRMSRMIDQLLDVTRARLAGGIRLEPKIGVKLCDVVTAAVDELRTFHPDAQVQVQADERICGSWDSDRLGRVVSNLVANAIQHGSGLVEVRVRIEEMSAVLEVHNGGAPIPADVLPRIFEPFRRASQRDTHGLGLGLFIAERIVIAHGGRIDVRSTEGYGTTFIVALPLDPEVVGGPVTEATSLA
jgi:signal transduction histidine kinase